MANPQYPLEDDSIDNLGSGSLFIGELETVDLSGLEQMIIALELIGSDQVVEI